MPASNMMHYARFSFEVSVVSAVMEIKVNKKDKTISETTETAWPLRCIHMRATGLDLVGKSPSRQVIYVFGSQTLFFF